MYIGPWQEYKLAKLLQASVHPPNVRSGSALRSSCGLAVQSPIDRLRGGGSAAELNDAASVSSSTRSGFSTRSAPPRASAQSRLESLYREHGHGTPASSSAASTPARGSRPPRPRSGSGPRGRPGAPRAAGRKPAKLSAEAERRARIAQMQQMYGLGAAQEEEAPPPPGQQAAPRASSAAAAAWADRPPPLPAPAWARPVPEAAADTQVGPLGAPAGAPPAGARPAGAEPPGEADLAGAGDTHDLIAWSRMLRPGEVSPDASLAAFFED